MSTNDKVLITELYPLIEKGLSKKENSLKIKKAVGEFLDRNTDKLTTIGPIHRIIFSDIDMNKLYDAIEVTPQQIKEIIKHSIYIKPHWEIMNNPFNSACVLAIRYYKIHKNEEMLNAVLIYLTLSMYPSLHHKYFEFEPNENIMNYTINNLSNKFKIKQTGTIYGALIDTVILNDKTYSDELINGTDKELVDYVESIKTRLNSLLKHIAVPFYENHKNKNYMNSDSDNMDDENYHETDSNLYAIERITNNIVLKLTVDGPNIRLINLAAELSQVSRNELRNYVTSMVLNDNRNDIKVIIESILFLFLFDSHNQIQELSSNKFILYCREMYRKSNTNDENIIKIKKILDRWLEDLGTYKKTQNLSTINSFRKALFMFFVISIQNANVS